MNEAVDPTVYANMVATREKKQVLSAIKDLVNADEIIETIRFQLTGVKKHRIKDPKTNQIQIIKTKYHNPLINELGANNVLTELKAFISPNVILSYLKEGDINKRSSNYHMNKSFELASNMINYEIYTRENHEKIRNILSMNFHAVLWRAFNGLTVLTSLKNISVSEVRDLNEQERGFGGFFKK